MTQKSAVLAKYVYFFFIHPVVFRVMALCILAHSYGTLYSGTHLWHLYSDIQLWHPVFWHTVMAPVFWHTVMAPCILAHIYGTCILAHSYGTCILAHSYGTCILPHSFLLWSIQFRAFSYIRHLLDCTNQIPTTQEHYQNRTRVFLRNLHPTDPSTIWSTLNRYCHKLYNAWQQQPIRITHMHRHHK